MRRPHARRQRGHETLLRFGAPRRGADPSRCVTRRRRRAHPRGARVRPEAKRPAHSRPSCSTARWGFFTRAGAGRSRIYGQPQGYRSRRGMRNVRPSLGSRACRASAGRPACSAMCRRDWRAPRCMTRPRIAARSRNVSGRNWSRSARPGSVPHGASKRAHGPVPLEIVPRDLAPRSRGRSPHAHGSSPGAAHAQAGGSEGSPVQGAQPSGTSAQVAGNRTT